MPDEDGGGVCIVMLMFVSAPVCYRARVFVCHSHVCMCVLGDTVSLFVCTFPNQEPLRCPCCRVSCPCPLVLHLGGNLAQRRRDRTAAVVGSSFTSKCCPHGLPGGHGVSSCPGMHGTLTSPLCRQPTPQGMLSFVRPVCLSRLHCPWAGHRARQPRLRSPPH